MKIPTSILFAAFMAISPIMNSQVVPDEFGMVKPEYLSMTTYLPDKQAEAVVLYDFGKTYFYDGDDGFRIIFERTRKIKILSKAGLDYATVEIPYYVENAHMERVYDIDGYTFNFTDGQLVRTRLDGKTTFDEKVNDHWMVKKFAMPDVKEGSVIEYKYKVISPYFVNLHDWEFQSKIPTVYSEYTVGMIPFYEYSYIFQGSKKFDVFKNSLTAMKRNYGGIEFPDNNYTFGMKNIPAFKDEAFITSINDYLMKMDFQLAVVHHLNGAKVDYITTWPLLNEKLLKDSDFGVFMKAASRSAEDILPTLAVDSKSATEKAEAITRYVKSNYNWDGFSSKFTGQTLKDFLRTKTGNAAAINLFLCSMLSSAGLEAYPVILSTRNNGKIPVDFPFQQFLNYVIVLVKIDNTPVLIDGTEPMSTFGMLPSRCINEKGLIVCKDRTEWIPLTDETISEETDSLYIRLNSLLDSAEVSYHITTSGHTALEYRRSYLSDKKGFENKWLGSSQNLKEPVKVSYEKEIDHPFIIDYKATMPVEMVGDRILIMPFPEMVPDENPLKISYRSYPVDMIYPETNSFCTVIEVPEGYKISDQQKDVAIDNSLVSIQYSIQNLEGKIWIRGSYTFKKAVYMPQEYYNLKNMYTEIVKTMNQKILLVKNAV